MERNKFTFVGLSGQAGLDTKATNKLVRSHVMRRYKRQQKTTSPKQEASPQSAEYESISDTRSSGDFPLLTILPSMDTSPAETTRSDHGPPNGTRSLARQNAATSEKGSTSSCCSPSTYIQTWLDGDMDPFSSLPINMNQRSYTLLRRNASSPLRTSVHADPKGIYKRTCSKDPAWLFMHLYYSALRFSQSSNGHNCEATRYLMESESAVSKSIRESPNAIDDSTIAAVACLANIENLNGEASAAYIHIGGLKRMVEIRGGLSNLGMQGILRRMVLWSDLLTSLNFKTVPHFPFTLTKSPFELWQFTPASTRNNYHLTINPNLTTIITQRHRIVVSHLLITLHQLTTFLNSVEDGLLPWDACYPDRVYELEYSIALSLYDDHVVAETDDKVQIGQLLLQATLLHIYTNLRQTPVGGVIRNTLLSRLRALLDDMDLVYHSQRFPTEILWVYFVGISASAGIIQAGFLNEARSLYVENQIEGCMEIMDIFKSMPALLDACMVKLMDVWLPTQRSDNMLSWFHKRQFITSSG